MNIFNITLIFVWPRKKETKKKIDGQIFPEHGRWIIQIQIPCFGTRPFWLRKVPDTSKFIENFHWQYRFDCILELCWSLRACKTAEILSESLTKGFGLESLNHGMINTQDRYYIVVLAHWQTWSEFIGLFVKSCHASLSNLVTSVTLLR